LVHTIIFDFIILSRQIQFPWSPWTYYHYNKIYRYAHYIMPLKSFRSSLGLTGLPRAHAYGISVVHICVIVSITLRIVAEAITGGMSPPASARDSVFMCCYCVFASPCSKSKILMSIFLFFHCIICLIL